MHHKSHVDLVAEAWERHTPMATVCMINIKSRATASMLADEQFTSQGRSGSGFVVDEQIPGEIEKMNVSKGQQ